MFPRVMYWLTCRHAQTIDYVIVQTPDPIPRNFISRTGWNSYKFWTMNTQNLSTLQVLQSFSHKFETRSEVRLLSLKRTTWRQRRDIPASEKGLQLIKVNTPPVINHLSWYVAVCLRSCLCVKQKNDYPVSYRAGTFKVSTFTKCHLQYWLTQERDKQRIFSKAEFFPLY